MEKPEQSLRQDVASFSIDQWQDDEPVNGAKLDSPIWGALVMGFAVVGLFGWSTLSDTGGNSNQPGFARIGPSPPAPSFVDDPTFVDKSMRESNGVNSLPSATPSGEPRNNGAQPTGDVSALLAELVEADKNGRSSYTIKQDLWKNGCDDAEIVRRLSTRLRGTVEAGNFERIILAMSGISYVVTDNAGVRRQFVNALAAAGQHLKTSQLIEMDQRVPSLILDSTQLPESVDLLGKLASIDDNWGQRVLTKLYRIKSDLSPEISVKIARENHIHPRHLRNKDSEVVCQYLWEGKLDGNELFSDVSIGNSEASINAFSKAVASKLVSDPRGSVDALMALSLHQRSGMNKNTLPKSLVQKLDKVLSTHVEKYFVGKRDGINEPSRREKKGTRPFAFLKLAQHLGGKRTAVAIAKMGNNNPWALEKFASIRDILLTVNEPETYDAIVIATAYHGIGRSNAVSKNIGPAIEPNFLRRIRLELKSQPTKSEKNDWVKRIRNLINVIAQIGTAKSIPVLKELAKHKNGLLSGLANKTLKNVRRRSVATASPKNPNGAGTIKVSTDSGQAFRSSIKNIVQGRIPRSVVQDRLSFDPNNMWHSGKLESGWATVELEFPEPVTLDKIQIYSQHTGKNHPVVAAKIFTVNGGKSKLRSKADSLKQVASLRFKSAKSRKWRLELQAGESKKLVVRGLRFFDGKRELYPPLEVPTDNN